MDHTPHKIIIPWLDNHQTMLDFQRVTVDGERATDVIEERNSLRARVAELEADNRRLDALVHGQDSHAVQAAWERMGGAPDPLNPGFFVCNSILTDQWEALRRAAFNEPQDQ